MQRRRWLGIALGVALLVGCASASESRPPAEQAAPARAALQPASAQPAPQPAAAQAVPPAPESLDFAYTSLGVTQAYLWLAQEVGYFGEEGLAVELHYVPGTSAAVQALLGRNVQLVTGLGAASVSAALGGADTVILATTTDHFTNILMSDPDLAPTAESVRGHTVAVTRFGASSDFVARYWLRRLGLEPGTDAPIIQVGGNPEMAAALVSGAAQIASVADLFALELQQQGYRELGDINGPGIDTVNNGLIASASYVAESRDVVRRFLRAALRGLDRFMNDEALATQVMARYSQVTDPEILAQAWQAHTTKYLKRIPYTTSSAVQMTLDELALTDERARTAKPEAFYDNQLVRELDDAGFFKQ